MQVGLFDVDGHVTVFVWYAMHLNECDVRLRHHNDVAYQLHSQQYYSLRAHAHTVLLISDAVFISCNVT